MKKALLCVSFGTRVEAARESITAVEEALQKEADGYIFIRAFTSPTIRRILAGRGEDIPSVPQALEQLAGEGVDQVLVQPTHVLYGHEYDKLTEDTAPFRDRFQSLKLGRPLLGSTPDIKRLAQVLNAAHPAREGLAVVLLGHGTDHFANAAYPALQTAFHLMDREDVLIGTVEGWPSYEDVERQLSRLGRSRVLLAPMMLVAGDHAINDMAGKEDSWKSRLEAAGFTVTCSFQGMGLLPEVQQLYCEHLREL